MQRERKTFEVEVEGEGGVGNKDVNTVPEAVSVWPPVQYISDTGQHQCTVSGLPLFYIFNICIYTHTHIHTQNLYLP